MVYYSPIERITRDIASGNVARTVIEKSTGTTPSTTGYKPRPTTTTKKPITQVVQPTEEQVPEEQQEQVQGTQTATTTPQQQTQIDNGLRIRVLYGNAATFMTVGQLDNWIARHPNVVIDKIDTAERNPRVLYERQQVTQQQETQAPITSSGGLGSERTTMLPDGRIRTQASYLGHERRSATIIPEKTEPISPITSFFITTQAKTTMPVVKALGPTNKTIAESTLDIIPSATSTTEEPPDPTSYIEIYSNIDMLIQSNRDNYIYIANLPPGTIVTTESGEEITRGEALRRLDVQRKELITNRIQMKNYEAQGYKAGINNQGNYVFIKYPTSASDTTLQQAREDYQNLGLGGQIFRALVAGLTQFPTIVYNSFTDYTIGHSKGLGMGGAYVIAGLGNTQREIILGETKIYEAGKTGDAGKTVAAILSTPTFTDIVIPVIAGFGFGKALGFIGKMGSGAIAVTGTGAGAVTKVSKVFPYLVGTAMLGTVGAGFGATAAYEQKGLIPEGSTFKLGLRTGVQFTSAYFGYKIAQTYKFPEVKAIQATLKEKMPGGYKLIQQTYEPISRFRSSNADIAIARQSYRYYTGEQTLGQRATGFLRSKLFEPTPREFMITEGYKSTKFMTGDTGRIPYGKATILDYTAWSTEQLPSEYESFWMGKRPILDIDLQIRSAGISQSKGMILTEEAFLSGKAGKLILQIDKSKIGTAKYMEGDRLTVQPREIYGRTAFNKSIPIEKTILKPWIEETKIGSARFMEGDRAVVKPTELYGRYAFNKSTSIEKTILKPWYDESQIGSNYYMEGDRPTIQVQELYGRYAFSKAPISNIVEVITPSGTRSKLIFTPPETKLDVYGMPIVITKPVATPSKTTSIEEKPSSIEIDIGSIKKYEWYQEPLTIGSFAPEPGTAVKPSSKQSSAGGYVKPEPPKLEKPEPAFIFPDLPKRKKTIIDIEDEIIHSNWKTVAPTQQTPTKNIQAGIVYSDVAKTTYQGEIQKQPILLDQYPLAVSLNTQVYIGETRTGKVQDINRESIINMASAIDLARLQKTEKAQKIGLLQISMLKQDTLQKQEYVSKTTKEQTYVETTYDYDYNPPEEPTKIKIKMPFKLMSFGLPEEKTKQKLIKKKANSYYPMIKARSDMPYQRASALPMTKSDAMRYAATVVGEHKQASFKLEPSSDRPTPPSRGTKGFPRKEYYYNKKKDIWVEKTKYRINSKGELAEITQKGLDARMRGMNTKGMAKMPRMKGLII